MTTEEEAKKLWCPYRLNLEGSAAGERCVASGCAMWRKFGHGGGGELGGYCTSERCVPGCNYGKGYCGLAGKP